MTKKGLGHSFRTLGLTCQQAKDEIQRQRGLVGEHLRAIRENEDLRERNPEIYRVTRRTHECSIQICLDRILKLAHTLEECCPSCRGWILTNRDMYVANAEIYKQFGIDRDLIERGLRTTVEGEA